MVTLRGYRMYEFLDRFINVALPRIKDFRGVSPKSFDKGANYTIGLEEQTVFPEIDYDQVKNVFGMNVTIVTDTDNKEHSFELLRMFNMPFKK
jgi:large subunit ribosomal protein L5